MVNKDKISINRNAFIVLVGVLILLVASLAYLYGNKVATDSYNYKFSQFEAEDSSSPSVELQAGVISLISDDLDEVQEELDSIDVDNM